VPKRRAVGANFVNRREAWSSNVSTLTIVSASNGRFLWSERVERPGGDSAFAGGNAGWSADGRRGLVLEIIHRVGFADAWIRWRLRSRAFKE